MSSDLAIRARGLGKSYPIYARPSQRLHELVSLRRWVPPRSHWAVRNVDLEVRRGETVGVVGRNGSGKSTLLEMISGTLEPTEGEVGVRGRVAALLELGAGFNTEFTGRENVRLNGTILGLTREELEERFDDITHFADIGDFLDQPVKTYSSGMFARLAFAVAIHATPDILVVDEILSVGDEAFQRKCFAKIDDIRRRGGSILFVSHAAGSVVELCDRAILLDAGEHLLTGSPRTIVALYQRLAYAPHDAVQSVRAEIAQEAHSPGSYESSLEDLQQQPDETTDLQPEPDCSSYLDLSLESKSALHYDPNGALIEDPTILTLDGHPVNCLSAGRDYVFRYSAHFDRDCLDVRYHTLVKTVTGLELGGGTHPAIGALGFEPSAGDEVTVSFEFCCALNPGVYFLNCGVTGNNGEQLHRIVDAVAFRVLPISDARTFGHVHFDHKASVAKVTRRAKPERMASAAPGKV